MYANLSGFSVEVTSALWLAEFRIRKKCCCSEVSIGKNSETVRFREFLSGVRRKLK